MKSVNLFCLIVLTPFFLSAQFNLCDDPEISMVYDSDTTMDPKEVESYIVEYNGKVYYTFDDGVLGNELWVYDGSIAKMVADIYPGAISSYPEELTIDGNTGTARRGSVGQPGCTGGGDLLQKGLTQSNFF